ncbi:NPQTN specific sortase B [Alkalibacterium sp. AK22]|uniref:class B sortase n=1 Tax=Alkalibacterium sp. AK22 TaxID=1229520 RepID=UPI00044554E3|nr:class B sortase [Alkalibacterium sp. AK22]EXJ22489.1 NPQTN specific sortase B [Alkalibacterium sp. AK22]
MMKKILLIIIGSAFIAQAVYALHTFWVQSNPVEISYDDIVLGQNSQTEDWLSSDEEVTSDEAVSRGSSDDTSIDSTDQDEDPMQQVMEELEEDNIPFAFSPNTLSRFMDINPDFNGWLNIENTAIDYPVVRGRDNSFYLDHDFNREPHPFGSIFIDHRNLGMGQDDHTIIYGHYTQNGHMFADLEKFLSEDFVNENPTITFESLFGERTFELFSVHVAPADPFFINESFTNPDLHAYFETLESQSLFDLGREFTGEEKLLTLISCNYTVDDGRIYVHAVEITE